MPGRTRDAVQTRAAILAAARLQFAGDGYDRTTIRSVATAARIDPSLVMHYFGSKDGLFRASAELDLDLPDLTGVAPDRVAAAVLPRFIAAWSPGGPLLGLLRASGSNPAAAQALLAVFVDQVAPAFGPVARDRAPQRAALIGAQLLGVAVARLILRVPPLVDMSDDELTAWLGPVIAHHLTDPAPHDRSTAAPTPR